MNDNDIIAFEDFDDEPFNLNDLQNQLEATLDDQFSELEDLKEDYKKIGSPEALGDTIIAIVWEQFNNQLGIEAGLQAKEIDNKTDHEQNIMDNARNEKGDRVDKFIINRTIKNNEINETEYKDVRKSIDTDPKFVNYKKEINEERFNNNTKIKDEYTGEILKGSEKHNVDHVIPAKKIFDDKARKLAGIKTETLANQNDNFAVTNENLNKSKGDKTNSEFINPEKRKQREHDLFIQLEKHKDKINSSNISDVEKRLNIEKAEKSYKNKINAKDDLMQKKEATASEKIDNDIKEELKSTQTGKILKTKEQGKMILSSSLKTIAMQLLGELLKNIIHKLVAWFKSAETGIKTFLTNFYNAIKQFLFDFKSHLKTTGNTLLNSAMSFIFGPIVGLLKKTWMFLKQGWKSLKEAYNYIKHPENRNKSFSILMLEVSKIIVAGLTVGGAIVLGEVIEKGLSSIPVFAIPIPLLGSLASILGIFFGAVISGIIGAIVLNQIDKAIESKLKVQNKLAQLDKNNEILNTQHVIIHVAKENLKIKEQVVEKIIENRHYEMAKIFNQSVQNIFLNENNNSNEKTPSNNELDDLFNKLNQL